MPPLPDAQPGSVAAAPSEFLAKGSIKRKEHLRYLDALRGFAALSVILVHCCILTDLHNGLLGTAGWAGQRGVQLFYVISAFTLCYSFDVRRTDERSPLRNYFIRRFFRIAPLYYVAIAANLFSLGLAPRHEAPNGLTVWEILSGVFFINGFHPYTINSIARGGWSIAVETNFYLVLPFILVFIRNLKGAFLLLAISAPPLYFLSAHIGHFYKDEITEQYFRFFWFPVEFPVFAMGILTYFLWKTYLGGKKIAEPRVLSLILIASSFTMLWTSLPTSDDKLYGAACTFIPFILGLSLCEWSALVNAFTVYLGRISYSIYLGHFFILRLVPHVWHYAQRWVRFNPYGGAYTCILTFIAVSIAATLLATITYYLIERPGIHLGGMLIRKWEKLPIADRL